ncbi:MAG: prolipoprotein diacylglyceryl transferase [Phycisphaeraceae bacterium]
MYLLAEPWLHNLDPFAIEIPWFPGGGIRWYGLSYLAGFVIGFLLIKRVLTVGVSPLKPAQAADLVVTIAIGIVLGGRLGYILFYRPELFIDFTPDAFPWWGALKINEGGMASHGGMLGGIGACAFFAWRHEVRFGHLMDLGAFGAPLGLLMGRVANFVNGELFGRTCEPDSPLYPLAVRFPQEIYDDWDGEQWQGDRVGQLIELSHEQGRHFQDTRAYIDYAITQAQAGDPVWTGFMHEQVTARYPSQLFAGLTEGVVVFLVLLFIYRKPVKAGVVAGWFSIVYALMRVLNELFRRPDEQFITDGQLPEITRGQWLSIGLFVMGVVIVVLASKREGDKLGGWMKSDSLATDEHR